MILTILMRSGLLSLSNKSTFDLLQMDNSSLLTFLNKTSPLSRPASYKFFIAFFIVGSLENTGPSTSSYSGSLDSEFSVESSVLLNFLSVTFLIARIYFEN